MINTSLNFLFQPAVIGPGSKLDKQISAGDIATFKKQFDEQAANVEAESAKFFLEGHDPRIKSLGKPVAPDVIGTPVDVSNLPHIDTFA